MYLLSVQDRTGSRDHQVAVSIGDAAPCGRRGRRLPRSQSDTELDATNAEYTYDANRSRVKVVSNGATRGAKTTPRPDRDVMRRSASVKARATGCTPLATAHGGSKKVSCCTVIDSLDFTLVSSHLILLLPTLCKGKVFPYSLPSVGPGADPGVQAVSPQVT